MSSRKKGESSSVKPPAVPVENQQENGFSIKFPEHIIEVMKLRAADFEVIDHSTNRPMKENTNTNVSIQTTSVDPLTTSSKVRNHNRSRALSNFTRRVSNSCNLPSVAESGAEEDSLQLLNVGGSDGGTAATKTFNLTNLSVVNGNTISNGANVSKVSKGTKRQQPKSLRARNSNDKENNITKRAKRTVESKPKTLLQNVLDLDTPSSSVNRLQTTTANGTKKAVRTSLPAIDMSLLENFESSDTPVMTNITRNSVLVSIDARKNMKSNAKRISSEENSNIVPKRTRANETNSNNTTFSGGVNGTHTYDAGLGGTNTSTSNTPVNDQNRSDSNVTMRKSKRNVSSTCILPSLAGSRAEEVLHGTENKEPLTRAGDRKSDTGLASLTLRSGKWRRLLSLYRRSAFLLEQTDVVSINSLKISLPNESNRQTLRHSVSFNFADNFNETADRRAARRRRTSVVTPNVNVERLSEFSFGSTVAARDTILRRCGQSEPLEFAHIYSESALRHCRKIGEGVYGEVFMNKTDAGRAIVLKIIPIEGHLEVNGEQQKKFDEVLSEIVIAQQLSSLRNDKEYMTSSFAEVVRVRCVQGRYPNHLIDLWELYRDNYQTENDHPEIFGDDQLYIVFELANGGQDLEAFQFANALQSKSAFQQMALALAIAEKKLQFEHRDLHWGNILLSPTDEKFVTFKLNGNTLEIPSEGIKVTIIDYTLSRMLYEGIVLYNDLSNDDELFSAHGDYQFDIYRLMKNSLENDWQRFEPFNNILWLHYIIDKLINGARYKSTKSRKHRSAIEELMVIRDEITNYKSAIDSVTNI